MDYIMRGGQEYGVFQIRDFPGRTDPPPDIPFPLLDLRRLGRCQWQFQDGVDGPLKLIQRGNVLVARVDGPDSYSGTICFGTAAEFETWRGA